MIYALLTLAAAQAQALPQDMARVQTRVVVPYSDLDLSSAAGRAKLERRIIAGARRACDESRVPSAAQQNRIAECVASARLRARQDIQQAVAAQDASRALARNDVALPERM
ncbi:MAG: UrcA family protein [Bacillota bacterium]